MSGLALPAGNHGQDLAWFSPAENHRGWEAFFLIGIWEMWRAESGSEPLGEHLSMVSRGCSWRLSETRSGSAWSPLSHKPAPKRAPNDASIGAATSEMPFVGGSGLLLIRAILTFPRTTAHLIRAILTFPRTTAHIRGCLRLSWPGGTRFVADSHTVSNAPDLF